MGKRVAQAILNQLGGGQFVAMTGAHCMVSEGHSLMFYFKGCRKANKCRVTLNGNDLYDVEFFKYSRKTFECPVVHTESDLFNDMLAKSFEKFTGLYTRL